MFHRFAWIIALGLNLAPARLAGQDPPGAGLQVFPTRLVLDHRTRSAEVTLRNSGTGPGTYRILLVGMEMDEDGGCRELPPGSLDPVTQGLIRFAPQSLTLEPGQTQTVRVTVRKPKDLPEGEYRGHLLFRELPPPPPEPGPGAPEAKGLSVTITALFGLAIPVMVRQGATSAKVTLSDLALERSPLRLALTMNREGNQSVHGDFLVTFEGRDGKPLHAGEANGVSVWTPNPRRHVRIPLSALGGISGPGRLRVTYRETLGMGGRLLAESVLEVPGP